MSRVIELKNYGASGYCLFDRKTYSMSFSNSSQFSEFPAFTGVYFKDENTFFALYPSTTGLMIYYGGKEYALTPDLHISLSKNKESRRFCVEEYGIEIDYTESPYIGFDNWSQEIDVDLFLLIEHSYRDQSFYVGCTIED